MATVRTRVNGSSTTWKPSDAVVASSSGTVRLDIVDRKYGVDGLGRDWVSVPRADATPALRAGARRLRELSLDVTQYRDAAKALEALDAIAAGPDPVVVAFGPAAGAIGSRTWRLTQVSVQTLRLDAATNEIMQASFTLKFVEVAGQPSGLAQMLKQRKPAPPAAVKSVTRTKTITVTVRSGDTLSGIAARYLHDADRYRDIATWNKIRNPDRIYPGQRLTLRVRA